MTSVEPLRTPLAAAVDQLRNRTRPRAVEIADDVLRNAMSAHRGSLPVRANAPYDYVRVSDQVIIATLRRRIDAELRDATMGRAFLLVGRDGWLQELTIELFVRYGEVLLDVADQARVTADLVLTDLLGPTATPVPVVVSHVHVSDVTIGDPHLVDPGDE